MIVELTPEILAALNITLNLAEPNILEQSFVDDDPELFNERAQQVNACEVINTLLETPTDPKQEKYLADQRCPSCGDHDVAAIFGTFGGEVQEAECNVCGATWVDQYRLVGFTDLKSRAEQ